ncbi:hypothetical protein Pfo_023426, partial [Paulownia fortunei]
SFFPFFSSLPSSLRAGFSRRHYQLCHLKNHHTASSLYDIYTKTKDTSIVTRPILQPNRRLSPGNFDISVVKRRISAIYTESRKAQNYELDSAFSVPIRPFR